jgi:carboxylesterase type B
MSIDDLQAQLAAIRRQMAQQYAELYLTQFAYPDYPVQIGLGNHYHYPSLTLLWGGAEDQNPQPDHLDQVWRMNSKSAKDPILWIVVAATIADQDLKFRTDETGRTVQEGSRQYLELAIRKMAASDTPETQRIAFQLSAALADEQVRYFHIHTVMTEDGTEMEKIEEREFDLYG